MYELTIGIEKINSKTSLIFLVKFGHFPLFFLITNETMYRFFCVLKQNAYFLSFFLSFSSNIFNRSFIIDTE